VDVVRDVPVLPDGKVLNVRGSGPMPYRPLPCPDVKYIKYILLYPDRQGGDDKASVRILSHSTPSRPVEREHLGRRPPYHDCCCRWRNVRNHEINQRLPTRTLGAFVPSNSPFIQTVPDTRICSSCPPTPSFAAFGPSLHIRLQGLFVGVKAPSLSQPVAFD
jgi:hypothetical protein